MVDFTLNILGKDIPILFKDAVSSEDGSIYRGVFLVDKYNEPTIEVSKSANMVKKQIEQTLLHEALHAVLWRIGIHNTNLSREIEEIIVDNIATFLVENWSFSLK